MKRAIGRPKGKASTVINVRMPVTLMHRLDRYLDRRTNRGAILRHALKVFLESKDIQRVAMAMLHGLPSRRTDRSVEPVCRPHLSSEPLETEGSGVRQQYPSVF